MSIKVSDFDYQYFIKQQFMINFVMGVLGFGLVFGLSNSIIKYIFYIFYILYVFAVIFIYMKYKDGRDLILFSKHRIFGHYFIGSIFIVLALTILSELGIFYLIVGVIFTFLLIFTIHFFNRNIDKDFYFGILKNQYDKVQEESLYSFYQTIDDHKNQSTVLSVIVTTFVTQIAFILVLNKVVLIPVDYEIPIMATIFFIIAGFILNKVKLYLMVPFIFLKKNIEVKDFNK